MAKINLDHDTCDGVGCAECVDVCPMELLL